MRRSIIATAVVGGILTLSACGGAETPGDSLEPAAETSSAAEEVAPSAEPTPEEPAKAAHAADLVELSEQMAAAQEGLRTVRMETTVSGEAFAELGAEGMTQSADVVIADSLEDMRMHMSMDMMGMTMEILLVDAVMYMDMGALTGTEGFVSIDLNDVEDQPELAESLSMLESADPAGQAALMADAVESFEYTGTEQFDGQEVDVYTATIDPTKVSDPAALGVDAETLAAAGDMTTESVFRLDADGLPVSVDMVVEMDGQEVVVATAYSDWGADLTIEAPPADQVTAYDEAMAG